jgi:hypothetical protein
VGTKENDMGQLQKARSRTTWVAVLIAIAIASLSAAPAARAADAAGPLQSSVDFGRVVAGTGPYTRHVTVFNSGTTTLNILSQGATGLSLNIGFGSCILALAPGAECTANFTFNPATGAVPGPQTGSVVLNFCSGACNMATVTITLPSAADVVPADTLTGSPSTLTFAATATQELSQPQTVTVTNGLVPMTLATPSVSGADPDDFVVLHDTCSGAALDLGQTCTFDVRFAPTDTGARTATLTVQGTTLGNVYPTVALTGTGGSLPAGATGATGAAGTPGAAGPAGPRGPAGQVEVITCQTVTATVGTGTHRHKVKRNRCSGKLSSGTVKFTTAGPVPAVLRRGGRVVATGTVSRAGIELRAPRRIAAGRATLRFRSAGGPRSMTVTIAA